MNVGRCAGAAVHQTVAKGLVTDPQLAVRAVRGGNQPYDHICPGLSGENGADDWPNVTPCREVLSGEWIKATGQAQIGTHDCLKERQSHRASLGTQDASVRPRNGVRPAVPEEPNSLAQKQGAGSCRQQSIGKSQANADGLRRRRSERFGPNRCQLLRLRTRDH